MMTADKVTKADSEAARDLGMLIAESADAKGATDIVMIEIGKLVAYTDRLVICTARNERMAAAIAEEVRMRVKRQRGLVPVGSDGDASTGWLVMDYLDCVLHIFTAEARERYQLEDLWREAPREDVSAILAQAAAASGTP